MRHSSFLLPIVVCIAVVVGGALYLFGGELFNDPDAARTPSGTRYDIVAQGTQGVGIDRRVNYRIRTQEEFVALWDLMYGTGGPAIPIVDFGREEVLAVFNGSHSTTGHAVRIADLREGNGVRTLVIVREEPGPACPVASQITSPYILIRVPASPLPIERAEETVVRPC